MFGEVHFALKSNLITGPVYWRYMAKASLHTCRGKEKKDKEFGCEHYMKEFLLCKYKLPDTIFKIEYTVQP